MTETYQREYYTEAYRIIMSFGEEYISKIPKSILDAIKTMTLEEYGFKYNPEQSFKEQNVKREAVALLAALKLKYWSNEEEKSEIKSILKDNKVKKEQEKNEKYSYDNLFKTKEKEEINNIEAVNEAEQATDLQIYNENGIMKIVNKIKQFFAKLFKRGV